MKIFLYGNHSRCHVGSVAVWARMNQLVKEKDEVELAENMKKCDCLIINGEGTMHDNKGIPKLKLGKKAKDLGKQVHFINSVWQNMTAPETEFIKEFDSVFVRESISFNEIKSIRPDAKIATDLAYDFPIIKPKLTRSKIVATAGAGIKREDGDIFRVSIKDRSTWQEYINLLTDAKYLYTIWHHEVIAACKLRIPFIAQRGNTDKVLGIMKRAGVDIPVANNKSELHSYIDDPPPQEEYDKLFDFLENQKTFTFTDLGI